MQNKIRKLFAAGSLLLAAALAGCATTASTNALVPQDVIVRQAHHGSVGVAVTGSDEVVVLLASTVSNAQFQKALETSLLRYSIFSQVIPVGGQADYRLEASLLGIKKPLFVTFDSTVTASVSWRLTDTRSGRILWQQTTVTPYTIRRREVFNATDRVHFAQDGAIRESIKAALDHITDLRF